ncbi:MAG TPA: D-aminoacyl-tRNA deacylase [Thermodesulfovibrionales bacterium]|nr:D-aminoacyl-tRNA deacylase [Thermodesulfovibrionales bacterium]
MKALIQRVSEASVTVSDKIIGHIGRGILLFVGVEKGDGSADIDYLVRKATSLRIFDDREGRMNLSLRDIEGSLLVISEFTLSADWRRGNRPSFDCAEMQERAEELYEAFLQKLRETGIPVSMGRFGASMQVNSMNDGPVTFLLDSKTVRCG